MNLLASMLMRTDVTPGIPDQERLSGILMCADLALKLDPWYHWILLTRGDVYAAGRKHLEAAEDFERALEVNPLNLEALMQARRVIGTPAVTAALSDPKYDGLKLLREIDLSECLTALSRVRNSDIPIDDTMDLSVFIHGFCPVNHGGSQPDKFVELKKTQGIEALSYLHSAFGIQAK